MPFIFLLLFALVCLQTYWPERPAWLTNQGCAMIVGTMVLASWLSAGLIAKVLIWRMTRNPEQRSAVLRRYAHWRRHHFIGLLAAYLASLYLLGWGSVLIDFWKEWFGSERRVIVPGMEIGLLAPFFIGLILAWDRFYKVEKTAYELLHNSDRFLTRRSYLLLQVRHQMLLVMPPIFLLLLQQILFTIFPDWDDKSHIPAIIATVMLATAFLSMPILLRLFLGLKPLPAGPLRERLEYTARRLRFGYSNVLVWHTRNLFANAMVTGFIPWLRYIVLTDRLIDELTPDEIEAVFGHEVGHIKHHHLFFYLAFFLTSFILLTLFWDHLKGWIPLDDVVAVLGVIPSFDGEDFKDTLKMLSSFIKLGLLAAYTLLFFGFISRRCERQADLFGAGTVSTDVFISALEKVADINGIPRRRSGNWLLSWQHPTIAQRVEFLQQMRHNPARVPRFHLSIVLMQGSLYIGLGFLLWVLWKLDRLDIWKLLAEF
jgi:Zn-dependent protease with chaperone function